MPPPRKRGEVLDLDSIEPKISHHILSKPQFFKDAPFGIKEKTKAEERRKDIFNYVVHILAGVVIIPYIFMIIWGTNIPKEYSTIVSIVIGFYFGKALFRD